MEHHQYDSRKFSLVNGRWLCLRPRKHAWQLQTNFNITYDQQIYEKVLYQQLAEYLDTENIVTDP